MNPTFMNIDSDFNRAYYDKGYMPATMGCRTYIMSNINGEPGTKGRGNIAPTTINMPRLGILAKGDIDKFFALLDNRMELAKESLLHRYEVLKRLKIKDLPFVAGQGLMKGSEGLSPDDSIEPILKQGTWSIGYIGLAETLFALLGKHHGESEEARELGIKIITHIRNYTDRTAKETMLNWSTYATPAEGLSGRFILQDRKVFGEIKGVTDKEYYTNSYHIPVGFPISITDKIQIEAPYHKLCNAGHISYIELDDYPNEDVIMDILNYAYKNTNISYIGINFHIKYCRDCGTYLNHGEHKCTKCGSANIQGISRVTGYLSLDERFGAGKYAERADRRSHTESHINIYD
jgi:ribonucleoside-triphosphate reductase